MSNSKVSPAEWEVLTVLWERGASSSPEVCDALAAEQEWHPKTVGTFLTRLVKKGIVSVERAGRVNLYAPRISREACVRAESDSFLKRVFRGASAPMLLHFVEQADLSEEEIRELQKVLKQKRK